MALTFVRTVDVNSGWVVAGIALIGAVIGALAWAGRTIWRLISRTTRFLDDYFGEPARDGVPARPGVMARLHKVEDQLTAIGLEVHPNSGHSLRDDVSRIRTDVTTLKTNVKTLSDKVDSSIGPK